MGTEMISSFELLMAIGLFGFIALGAGFGALLILRHLRRIYHHQDPLLYQKEEGGTLSEGENLERDAWEMKNYQLKEFWPIIPIFIMFIVFTGFQLYQVVANAGFLS